MEMDRRLLLLLLGIYSNLNSERNISRHGITDLLRLQYNYSFHLGTPAVMTAQRLLATLFLYN
jgi:hypothetical protein